MRVGRRSSVRRIAVAAAALACAAPPGAAAATKQKTRSCGQTSSCSTSLSSQPPFTSGSAPAGGGTGGGISGGGGPSGSAPATPYSSFSVDAKPRTTHRLQAGSKLIARLDAGRRLVCPGYTRKDKSWFEFMLTSKKRIGITYVITDTIHNASSFGLGACAGLHYRFKTQSGKPAHRATLPDGTPGFVGLLPSCRTSSGSVLPAWRPCVASVVNGVSGGQRTTTLRVRIPATSQTDPWMGG